MKIGVVTVFKSINPGSFLQAWALKEKLSSMGHSVSFIDYDSLSNAKFGTIKAVIKCCFKLRFKRAKSFVERTRGFNKLQKTFNIAKLNDPSLDLCVFGSDTIWNFDDRFFGEKASFFTGANVSLPCYSYAVSVGSTNEQTFMKNEIAVKAISKFKNIAVRDDNTYNIVTKIYSKDNVVYTVDPTILIDRNQYLDQFSSKKIVSQKNLVVYYFGSMSNDLLQSIKGFATKRGLKIIYVGLHDERFDECYTTTPQNFITMFANADYIFTNTFHGCVFSTIFNKQFATDAVNKTKVKEFLERFNLSERKVFETEQLEQVFCKAVDYNKVNEIIEKEKKKSIDYLYKIVEVEKKL